MQKHLWLTAAVKLILVQWNFMQYKPEEISSVKVAKLNMGIWSSSGLINTNSLAENLLAFLHGQKKGVGSWLLDKWSTHTTDRALWSTTHLNLDCQYSWQNGTTMTGISGSMKQYLSGNLVELSLPFLATWTTMDWLCHDFLTKSCPLAFWQHEPKQIWSIWVAKLKLYHRHYS